MQDATLSPRRSYSEFLAAKSQLAANAGFEPIWLPDWSFSTPLEKCGSGNIARSLSGWSRTSHDITGLSAVRPRMCSPASESLGADRNTTTGETGSPSMRSRCLTGCQWLGLTIPQWHTRRNGVLAVKCHTAMWMDVGLTPNCRRVAINGVVLTRLAALINTESERTAGTVHRIARPTNSSRKRCQMDRKSFKATQYQC